MSTRISIAQFGLGPIGIETLKLAAGKPWAAIVGAIDKDPVKVGRDLGDLTGVRKLRGRRVYPSLGDLLTHARPQLIFHTAVSRFQDAFSQLEPMARAGISVVSSCEEMVFPGLREPVLAARLDRLCRATGTRLVGTGVNPGFVMDVLPLCLTGVCCDIRAVRVQRVVDASTRREPLQRKIGSGLAPSEFARRFHRGQIGHAGLKESLALIACALGWKVRGIAETGNAIVAKRAIRTRFLEVRRGETCGLHQRAEARLAGGRSLTLDLQMYLDAPNPLDSIEIEGNPPLHVKLNGGVAGDQATVAALVNTAPHLLQAKPGLRLMTELSLPCFS